MTTISGAPNQDRNAGNAGDVWKHRTLLALANLLLDAHSRDRPFRYFESHAGKGIYRLADAKGAGRGVHAAVRSLRSDDPYVLAEREAVARGEYLGSWKLVLGGHFKSGHLSTGQNRPFPAVDRDG